MCHLCNDIVNCMQSESYERERRYNKGIPKSGTGKRKKKIRIKEFFSHITICSEIL